MFSSKARSLDNAVSATKLQADIQRTHEAITDWWGCTLVSVQHDPPIIRMRIGDSSVRALGESLRERISGFTCEVLPGDIAITYDPTSPYDGTLEVRGLVLTEGGQWRRVTD